MQRSQIANQLRELANQIFSDTTGATHDPETGAALVRVSDYVLPKFQNDPEKSSRENKDAWRQWRKDIWNPGVEKWKSQYSDAGMTIIANWNPETQGVYIDGKYHPPLVNAVEVMAAGLGITPDDFVIAAKADAVFGWDYFHEHVDPNENQGEYIMVLRNIVFQYTQRKIARIAAREGMTVEQLSALIGVKPAG